MQPDRVRRTALAVAVLGAVVAIAASASALQATLPARAADSPDSLNSDGGTSTGASGAGAPAGPSGATGSTSPAGSTGTTGTSGVTGISTDGGSTSTTTSTTTTTTTSTTALTGSTGATGSTGPSTAAIGAAATSTAGATGAFVAPVIDGSGPQPQSGSGPSPASRHGHSTHRGGGGATGPTAPSPALFAGSNPLAGVLPGSWEDPFIVNGGAEVPQFYVDSFHIPPFLLPVYQAAGAVYGIPWQTLAAINEVETDYGTNLDTSSAGAIGWMQFLPSTWRRYGVDATGSGTRDPYNAADAIFAAARYLAAAGAKHNLPQAIFAYNHSHAYVRSVLLRAELLSGEPSALLNSVSELAEGDFPIQLRYHASYAPAGASHTASAARNAATNGASGVAPAPGAVGAATVSVARTVPAAKIFASSGAAVVAAQDATVVAIGRSRALGRYVVLRNGFGDRFTYAGLASVSAWYPTPRPPAPSAALLSSATPAGLAPGPRPTAPASAGAQSSGAKLSARLFRHSRAATAGPQTAAVATINLRSRPSAATLFTPLAALERAALVRRSRAHHSLLERYFTGAFGLRASHLELARLTVGSHVLAGTILGHLARTTAGRRPHLLFELRPAGIGQSPVDPRPFLDAWSQLATLGLHRDSFNPVYYGPNLHAESVGALLLASQVDIERTVLQDTHVTLPACERTAIATGNVDRRVLAALEVLVVHGIDPSVSGAWCASGGHKPTAPALLRTPNAVALRALDGQAAAGVASVAIKALAALHGAADPQVSERTVPGELVIWFAPARQPSPLAAAASFTGGFALSSARWTQLDLRLAGIGEPRLPTAISAAALPLVAHHAGARAAKHS